MPELRNTNEHPAKQQVACEQPAGYIEKFQTVKQKSIVQPDTPTLTMRANIPHPSSNLDEDTLSALWFRLEAESLTAQLFHDGRTQNLADFLAFMTADNVFCYTVFSDENPVAFCWLNNFSGKAAMIHFAVFRSGIPSKQTIGRYVVEHLLLAKQGEEYCFDALYGLTPATYRHVIRFIRQIGFRTLGVIPSAITVCSSLDSSDAIAAAHPYTTDDGVLSVISRADLSVSL